MARKQFRGSKRHGDWSGTTPPTALTPLSAGSVVLSQIFTPLAGGETVIRTRGLFGIASDQVSSGEDQIGAVGICVVSEAAVSVGISAVPLPDSDAGWGGWLWHSYFAARLSFASSIGFQPNMLVLTVIDSKAMRKVGDEDRLIMVVQNSSSSHGIVFFDSFRIYSKPF